MECACSIDPDYDYDGEYRREDSASEDSAISAADVECTECGRTITAGTTYEKTVFHKYGKDGDTVEDEQICNVCPDCLSLRSTFFCSFAYGCLWEDFRTHVEETNDFPYALLAELTPAARTMACEAIEEAWADIDDEE